MPRQPRYFIPDIPQHVIQRGVDQQAAFFESDDYGLYLRTLDKAARQYECQVHAYVLMTNHTHLLVTPGSERTIPLIMQAIGRSYVQTLNKKYERTGTLWQGRYKASLVQDDVYLLACQKYIELNPVRAGLVEAPGDYPYSSFLIMRTESSTAWSRRMIYTIHSRIRRRNGGRRTGGCSTTFSRPTCYRLFVIRLTHAWCWETSASKTRLRGCWVDQCGMEEPADQEMPIVELRRKRKPRFDPD